MLEGRIKLVIKTAKKGEEEVVRNKLSFTFSMWEENKYYCGLFLQLFCGPGVLSLWFLSGKFLWWQYSSEEYKWATKSRTKVVLMKYQQKTESLHLLFLLNIELVRHQSPPHSKWGNFSRTWYFCLFFFYAKISAFSYYPQGRKGK